MNKLIKKIKENKPLILGLLIIFYFLSFFIVDLTLRYKIYTTPQRFYNWYSASPNFFSLSWISAFVVILLMFSKKTQKIIYVISMISVNSLFIAQWIHFKIFDRFLGISDVFLVGEGKSFFKDVFVYLTPKFYIFVIGLIILNIITYKLIDAHKEINKKHVIKIIIIGMFLMATFRVGAFLRLGTAVDPTAFDATHNVYNAYMAFNNQNKNIQVSGLYETSFKNTYLFFANLFGPQQKEKFTIASEYFANNEIPVEENEYTDIFKDKNIIYILLESVDTFPINEELMPTLTMMQKEGMNFTNRFATVFGGGWTFNTEFAANVGLYSVENSTAAYNHDGNDFKYSLANMFKNDGYTVNSFHANGGKFYNRDGIHSAFGYEKYHSLSTEYADLETNFFSDKEIVSNDEIYRLIAPKEEKFMSFIITFTPHVPYTDKNVLCNENPYNLNIENNETLSCYRNLVKNTDEMLEILIQKLEEDNILKDTVFVLFGDHYIYGFSPIQYVHEQKGTNDPNMLQRLPFIIWTPGIETKTIDTVVDTEDFVPTIANMFGLSTYNPNNHLSTDVFSKYHDNYVYFNNDAWYNGEFYYPHDVTEDTDINFIEEINRKRKEKISVNDAIIISDYYRRK